MSAPGFQPRSRPGSNKVSPPAPPDVVRPKSGAPPLPAPRSSLVSSLAKNFGGGTVSTGNSSPVVNHGGTLVPPNGPPPPLPTAPRPTANTQMQQLMNEPATSSPKFAPPISKPPVLPTSPVSPLSPVSLSEVPKCTSMSTDSERFGSCLQNCYETITKRHDDELLVLESMRSHVFQRARLDKEYAENLAKMNGKANRKMATLSNNSSAIVQAWLCFLSMSESIQKQISNGAVQMSGVLLHSVDNLIKDKRGAKIAFDQDRTKIESECNASCKAVQELRRAYLDCVKRTDLNKKKLEVCITKDPSRLADQEKFRKKFVQAAEKLHNCHNDYSLALVNANIHIDHHHTGLLPFCLDTLQQRMEMQITQWKDAMLNYSHTLDMTLVYQEKFELLFNTLELVEQESEYVEFIRENRKETPQVEHYEFDTGLLSEPSAPEAEPGQLVLNNLTHSNLHLRVLSVEQELEQLNREVEQKEEALTNLLNGVDDLSSPPSNTQPILPKHVREAKLRARLKELACGLARHTDQLKMVKETLAKLPEDEVPPLFDEQGEGVDPKDLDMNQLPNSSTSTIGKKRGFSMSSTGKFHTMIAKRFKKKGIKVVGNKSRSTSRSSEGTSSVGGVSDSAMCVSDPSFEQECDSEDDDTYEVPPTDMPVEEEDWYYGDIDRKVAEAKCKANGDYIVRYSERQAKYVLTCNWRGQGKHFVIQQFTDESGIKMFRFEAKAFNTIKSLLDYHVDNGTAVTRASEAIIQKPVAKHDKWSISHANITIGSKIGKGAFGDVFAAKLNGTKVAVKSCRSSEVADMDKFMMEADILKQYSHPNIVRLLGVCADEEPVYIVMEFMPGGALIEFLRKKGSRQTKKKLCSMCMDASRGMAYLESKNCIHRDLAARNCLVGDNDSLKISDFGMSREDDCGIYIVSSGTRQIPIKWTAPEALNYGKYSSPSDVWSFGVLLWEVYSCGSAPYPGMSNHDARSQIEFGYRMPPPIDCPEEVYGVMQQCWQYDPEERPDFETVLNMLTQAEATVNT